MPRSPSSGRRASSRLRSSLGSAKLFTKSKWALASHENGSRLRLKLDERRERPALMDKRLVPSGDEVRAGAGAAAKAEQGEWRAVLHRYAEHVWRGATRAPNAGTARLLGETLGPLADDALKIVEAYALGAPRSADAQRRAEFGNRLDIVLNGIESSLDGRRDRPVPEAPPHVIQSELWQILRRVRESAELSYAREHELIELDRRILFLLQSAGPLVPADISSGVGVDKAQVSRSVKRLLEQGLVEREQIRTPLRLTRDGQALMKRMLRMAELRNRELTIEIGEDELSEFYVTVDILLDRAVALYEQERELAGGRGG